jgi:phenylacetate-coenzyme A ligase PaaK-like adenylate-forming protein
LRFKAIKYAFKRHYEKNSFYKNFCKEQKIEPDDIKKSSDLTKIPLVPDKFFKDYPTGKDFALWLSTIYTGNLPEIVIKKKNPSFDDVIKSFNAAGLNVSYSSGTSGRHTFIPRDQRTFSTSEYAIAKSVVTMAYPIWEYDMYGYLLMPNPNKNNIFVGKVCSVYFDAIKDIEVAIDREITTELIQATMSGKGSLKNSIVKFAMRRVEKKMIDNIIKWIERRYRAKDKISFVGAPFILHFVMNKLEKEGKTFNFGENGAVVTGGGWKVYEDERMPVKDFRERVEKIFGIPPENCFDLYGMVEGNGWMVHCPEGHYLHIPYSYLYPMVLDEEFEQMDYGELGRFAFLDPVANSYPGFIMTGDRVKLLERCPVCDRPGPVLEPEVERMPGEEIRGCAEELRKMLSMDLGR